MSVLSPKRSCADDVRYRTANVLVKHYGEDATLEAAQRADAMLEKGSLDGQRVWKRVLKAEAESSIGTCTQPRMV